MKFRKPMTLAAAGLAIVLASPASAFDLANDFSITNGNPNGPWTYGYTTSLGSSLIAFSNTFTGSVDGWYTSGLSGDNTPSVFKNMSGSAINGVDPGKAGLHSGPSGEFAVARLTLSTAATYTIAGAFGVGDIGSVDLHILVNGVSQFSQLGTTAAHAFDFDAALAAGDTVDFVVGYAGDYRWDTTPLNATVTPVPEPATMSIAAAGAIMAFRRRRAIAKS